MYGELQNYAAALRTYITSTYHISNPELVELRDALLEREGAIAQRPYIESTARYASTRQYASLAIPSSVRDLLTTLVQRGVVFGRPYDHQASALELALAAEYRDIVVTTGTGSGKTETFLLPILGRVAAEASASSSFSKRAVRALLLYPMNALVNDQLGRLTHAPGFTALSGKSTLPNLAKSAAVHRRVAHFQYVGPALEGAAADAARKLWAA